MPPLDQAFHAAVAGSPRYKFSNESSLVSPTVSIVTKTRPFCCPRNDIVTCDLCTSGQIDRPTGFAIEPYSVCFERFAREMNSLSVTGTLVADIDVGKLKQKAISLRWEFMFARSLFGTPDMADQSKLLNEVASRVDAGRIRSTATESAGKINAATLKEVHAKVESNTARGKIVLASD